MDVFNGHLTAGVCPYPELIGPWTREKAAGFLTIYNGTLILDRNGIPVGFGGLIDYTDPTTTSEIAPDAEPEITVVALRFDRLDAIDVISAAKRLAAAMGRELQRMGFRGCQMLIKAQPIFDSSDWYTRHMTVRQVRRRDGADHAFEVSFDVNNGLAALAAEGF